MNEYKENLLYARIGQELIDTEDALEHIRENEIRIRYLESNKPAGKSKRITLGKCMHIKEKTRSVFEALGWKKEEIPDFCIIIYKERIHGFQPEQLRILIFHELLHIGVKEDSDTGEITLFSVKHDLEDFRYIIDTFGSDWADDKSQITWQQLYEEDPDPMIDKETGEILQG